MPLPFILTVSAKIYSSANNPTAPTDMGENKDLSSSKKQKV